MRHFSNRLAARIGGVLPRKLFNRHNLVTVCGLELFPDRFTFDPPSP